MKSSGCVYRGILTGEESVRRAKHGGLRRLVRGDHVEVSKHYWKDVESFPVAEELFAVSSDGPRT